jgi:hypothetical protein
MGRVVALLCCLLLGACTVDRDARPTPTPAPRAVPTPTCPASADIAGAEQQGAAENATLWAMVFSPRATAGQQIKIVWRMTGSGSIGFTAAGPGGTTVRPVWGPEPHGGSSFQRPGEEWGTGWVFPAAGCWTIKVQRTSGAGRLTLRVAEKTA